MRPLHFVRRNPLVLLGLLAAAFAVWVWQDTPPDTPDVAASAGPLQAVSVSGEYRAAPPVPAAARPRLKPGMTRTQVEGLIGTPTADGISPATVSGERVTYRTTYQADAGALVTLEFDATKPGHPLVGVHDADPLF